MADLFEQQLKLFELQTKLIEVMGKWNVDMAEAEKRRAEAETIQIRNAILRRIDNQLGIAMKELNRQKRLFEDRLARSEKNIRQVMSIKTGKKPTGADTLVMTWSAFDWFLNYVPATDVKNFYGALVADDARSADNFVAVGVSASVTSVPPDVTNLGQLTDWTRAKRIWFAKAKPAHMLLLDALSNIEAVIGAIVKGHEDRLEKSQDQTYRQLADLRRFLGLPEGVEKSPSLPKH